MNRWWAFDKGQIPGVGAMLVNVANGNFVVQNADVDIPERGVALSFHRTYNVQSRHDYVGSDGSTISNYGTGWTNTFDAHIALASSGSVLSVYDVDGARYDYSADGLGHWIAPAGMHYSLTSDGSCGYLWTKKDGTTFYFYSPSYSTCAAAAPGYNGRLYEVIGRNHNSYVQLQYSWDTVTAPTSAQLSQIVAQHSDGQSITLQFADVNGRRLLSSITRPDGAQITYSYDANGNLGQVSKPGNNAGAILSEYGYSSGNQLQWVSNDRWIASNGAEGSYTQFTLDGSSRVTNVQLYGVANWIVSDGTNTTLQPNMPTGAQTIAYKTYTYTSGETDFSDTDGHASKWLFDASGRLTQTQQWTGSIWLASTSQWDAQNNLIASTDVRGNQTDYQYDSNGNQVATAAPAPSSGAARPTTLSSYDTFNNLIASCDPEFTHSIGKDWNSTGTPAASDSLCPNQAGAERLVWTLTNSNEPYGYMTDLYSPGYGIGNAHGPGYHVALSYNSSAEGGGDYGLPTGVTGDSFTEADGTSIAPSQTINYDKYGNVLNYSRGFGSFAMSFDSLHRMASTTDADGHTSYICYYPNNQIYYTESASQRSMDGTTGCVQYVAGSSPPQYATTHKYDGDGNEVWIQKAYGCVSGQACTNGITQKWYDGADRLVETYLPPSPSVNSGTADPTRYFYDLSQNKTISITGPTSSTSYAAHGRLFKTQRYIIVSGASAATWLDVDGDGFDALDRRIAHYFFQPGTAKGDTGTLRQNVYTYDGSAGSGLIASRTDALGQSVLPQYDNLGRVVSVSFQGDGGVTPALSYQYDLNNRLSAVGSTVYGSETYTYDADGQLVQSHEFSGNGFTAPAVLTYDYYANGWRKDLQVSAPVNAGASLVNGTLLQYSYRADGRRSTLKYSGAANPFAWTYSNGGRVLTQTDPYTGSTMPYTSSAPNGTLAQTSLQPMTYSYDGNGNLLSLALPEGGQYNNIQHDAEGEISSYDVADPNFTPPDSTYIKKDVYSYNNRGGLTGETATSGGGTATTGTTTTLSSIAYNNGSPSAGTVDPRDGAYLGNTAANSDGSCRGSVSPNYDTDGRYTSLTENCFNSTSTGDSETYDALNHTRSDYCGGGDVYGVCSVANHWYGWGPEGHVAQIFVGAVTAPGGTPSQTYSLHWDGNTLLFATDSAGNLAQLNIEQLGSYNSINGSFTVYDRDFSGRQVSAHTGTTSDNWNVTVDGYRTTKYSSYTTLTATYPGYGNYNGSSGSVIAMARPDGYADANDTSVVFQGVRAYSPFLQQWTTQDPAAGQPDSPMTQFPYLWNGNNPVANSDSSGFDWKKNAAEDAGGSAADLAAGYVGVFFTLMVVGAAFAIIGGPLFEGALVAAAIPLTIETGVAGLSIELPIPITVASIPEGLVPYTNVGARLLPLLGEPIGEKIADTFFPHEPDEGNAQDTFVMVIACNCVDLVTGVPGAPGYGTVVDSWGRYQLKDGNWYSLKHGVMTSSEGLGGAANALMAAISGNDPSLAFCWSCANSTFGLTQNPYPGYVLPTTPL